MSTPTPESAPDSDPVYDVVPEIDPLVEDPPVKYLQEKPTKLRSKWLIALILISGVLAVFLIFFIYIMFPYVFQHLVNTQVVLKKGTLSFEQWLAPTPPIYKIITVYNVTNTAEVEAGGQPVLQPLGPYYFREFRERVSVDADDAQEISFGEKKWYEFDYNKTNADMESGSKPLDPATDNFTTFNIPYIGIAYNLTLSQASFIKILGVIGTAAALGEDTLFMNKSVQSVVFGFTDPLLTDLSVFMPGLPTTVQLLFNMSEKDISNRSMINSGRHKLSQLAQYKEWQGYTSLPYWGSDAANTINGTEGLFFAPDLDKTKLLSTFVDDLFRSTQLEFACEEVVKTLNTYKYQIPLYSQLNATNNPINEGFYSFGPDGLGNLTAAVGAPIFPSKPSFLDAEDWLQEEVTGLPPADKEKMDTNIWVEPHTGVTVQAMKQLQINIMIFRQRRFPGLKTLRSTPRYVPIAKVLETGGMDDELLTTFKNKVFRPKYIFTIVLWAVFGISCSLCVVSLVVLVFFEYRVLQIKPEDEVDADLVKPLLNSTPINSENIYS